MEYCYKKMGKLILQLRRKRGYSQEALRGLAGIGRSHLAMIEAGRKNASVETLCRIAEALDLSMSGLFRLYESEPKKTLDKTRQPLL